MSLPNSIQQGILQFQKLELNLEKNSGPVNNSAKIIM